MVPKKNNIQGYGECWQTDEWKTHPARIRDRASFTAISFCIQIIFPWSEIRWPLMEAGETVGSLPMR